jgi:uncharacterized integral membrane protein (TIGR00697 family)
MQKLDLLIALYIGFLAIAELMGAKTIPIFNIGGYELTTTTAIFVMPLIFTINDIITEVYGPERTRSIIRAGLIVVALFSFYAILFTSLPPSKRFMLSEPAYDRIFSQSARISVASLIAFAVSEFTDVFVFVRIRKSLGRKALWLRNNASNFISQFSDTVIFMSLAFYAPERSPQDNFAFLIGLIIPYWLMKCSMSVLETPLVYIGVKCLKKS